MVLKRLMLGASFLIATILLGANWMPQLNAETHHAEKTKATYAPTRLLGDDWSNSDPDVDVVSIARDFTEMLPIEVLPVPSSRPMLPVTGNKPFPKESPENEKFVDKRTPSERYLTKKPANITYVEQGDKDLPLLQGTNGKLSYVDHPKVQPRPQRSKHYRLFVENDAKLPTVAQNDTDLRPDSLPEIFPRDKVFVTYVQTAPGMFPETDPFKNPPGTNMLPTVYQNMRDRYGNEMVNTLPSHPNNPYNLHVGEPVVTRLPTHSSPTDDLRHILDSLFELTTGIPPRRLWEELDTTKLADLLSKEKEGQHNANIGRNRQLMLRHVKWAIDMLEGNDREDSKVPSSRAYRGFALLHHSGHKQLNPYSSPRWDETPDEELPAEFKYFEGRHRHGFGKRNRVTPVFDNSGNVVGGEAHVHQIWYDGRIESDTMFFDFGWDDETEPAEEDLDKPHRAGKAAQLYATSAKKQQNPRLRR